MAEQPNIKVPTTAAKSCWTSESESVTVMEVSIGTSCPRPTRLPSRHARAPARPGSAAPCRTTPGSEVAAVAERPHGGRPPPAHACSTTRDLRTKAALSANRAGSLHPLPQQPQAGGGPRKFDLSRLLPDLFDLEQGRPWSRGAPPMRRAHRASSHRGEANRQAREEQGPGAGRMSRPWRCSQCRTTRRLPSFRGWRRPPAGSPWPPTRAARPAVGPAAARARADGRRR